MRYRLQSLSGLLAFDAAARHGSLTLAARELGRTQSAVSQQVKGLEEQVGVTLFSRRPRAIELTGAGRVLARAVARALEGIDASVSEISRKHEPNVIRLTAYHSFAMHWLIPRLARFNLRHPEVDVRLNADDRVIDLAAEGYDLAVRGGRIGYLPEGAQSIRDEEYLPVYAPQLAPGKDLTIEDVRSYPLLGYDVKDYPLPGSEESNHWRRWFDVNGLKGAEPVISRNYSHSGLLIQAALVGAGIGIAPLTNASEALADGRLKCVRGVPLSGNQCFYLVPAQKPAPEAVAMFASWIRDEMADMETRLGALKVGEG
ncbi:LysR substrate-binding domain-containing protein [Kordiimonas sp.]|uniref:LysR substrate-binding domain-containing protein n=1 Tax=Kordiimonas sp. TaxID=1970157 RepID=UPI003A938167